jgi:hypothetical protein
MAEPLETRTISTVQRPYTTSGGERLYLSTSTVVKVDSNGKYVPNSAEISLKLHTGTGFMGADFKTVAIRKAGEQWRLTQDGNQNTVAGIDLQRTLANRNSLLNIGLNNDVSNVLSAPLQGVPAGEVNTNNQQSSNAAIGRPQVAPPEREPSPATGGVDLDAKRFINTTIAAKQTKEDFKDWSYPINRSPDQDVIIFTMLEYTPPSGLGIDEKDNRFTGQIRKNQQKKTPLGRVILPIQPTIVDNNSVGWQQDNLSPLELAALDLSLGTITGGIEGARGSIERIVGSVTGDQENVRKGILAGFASAAIGKNVIARVTGAILNPNIELLFNAPMLRSFNYRFQLSAREKPETDQILGIIRWFKRGMAVRRTPAELFLSTPNVFNIQYLLRGSDHPYINRIKTCALTNCSVDYTPTGSYMTFNDGSMVSYTINLTFEELEPIYSDDYDKVGGVGF